MARCRKATHESAARSAPPPPLPAVNASPRATAGGQTTSAALKAEGASSKTHRADGAVPRERSAARRCRTSQTVAATPATEADLIARARRGDEDACAAIVRAHQQPMFRTALLIGGDAADAEDAVQEAFVRALRALDRFRDGEPLRPWLIAIVANEARNRRRSAGRRTGLLLRAVAAGEGDPGAAVDAGPEHAALAAERRDALLTALGRMREDDRLVISCRHLLDLSEAETAAALGVRPGTVKSRLSRALARLHKEVGDDV